MRVALFMTCLCVLQMPVKARMGVAIGKIVTNAEAAIAHGGHCYTDTFNLGILQKNEEKRIASHCMIATCLDIRNRNIRLTGCGEFTRKIQPPCHVVEGDLSRPFPKCCFKIECPEGMEVEEKRLNEDFSS